MGNKSSSARSRRSAETSSPSVIVHPPSEKGIEPSHSESPKKTSVVWQPTKKWEDLKASNYQRILQDDFFMAKTDYTGDLYILPREIQMYILSFLTFQELCEMSRINWTFNYLTEEGHLWKDLFLKTFQIVVAEEQQQKQHQMQTLNWKLLFKDEFLFGGVWNPLMRGNYLNLLNDNYTVEINGPGWTSIMVGKNELPPIGKHRYRFRLDSDSEGMMIALVNNFEPFRDNYPGSGHHGITSKLLHNSFSISYYAPRKKYDIISFTIDFGEWTVNYQVENQKGKEVFNESAPIPDVWREEKSWTVICSLCSLGEMVSIVKN